jgi:sulfatase maturation enzyme AslB (radical SAM superfamily)
MRGNAQNKDIDNVTIDKILEGVTKIGVLTFTGGEPSLAVDRIRYIYEQIKKRGIELYGFYVITNGKVASLELVHVLIDLYALIDYPEDAVTALIISQDQYHEDEVNPLAAHNLYKALRFYDPESRKKELTVLINEGRAQEYGMGEREATLETISIEVDDDDQLMTVEGVVYVNALGDVIPSCDMSFESQEQNKLGNIYDKPLSEILASAVLTPA